MTFFSLIFNFVSFLGSGFRLTYQQLPKSHQGKTPAGGSQHDLLPRPPASGLAQALLELPLRRAPDKLRFFYDGPPSPARLSLLRSRRRVLFVGRSWRWRGGRRGGRGGGRAEEEVDRRAYGPDGK